MYVRRKINLINSFNKFFIVIAGENNTGMVVKCNLIENAWFSAYRHFNKSGGVKLLTWPQTLDYTMQSCR
jgi:hypothetical protein